MNKILILCRGISGSGKSTFAEYILELVKRGHGRGYPGASRHSADKYFEITDKNNPYAPPKYIFDSSKLYEAHQQCIKSTESSMCQEYSPIIIENTNTTDKELKPYLELASKYGYKVVSLIVEKRHEGQNIHSVPDETIQKQAARLKNSIKLI